MNRDDRVELLLIGLAAGDSLGSTSEFYCRSEIPGVYARYSPEGWPFRQVGGGKHNWNRGEPTDDTEMALCLVRSWKEMGRFDGMDVARRFVQWKRSGPKDIGNTTATVLSSIQRGLDWTEAGRRHWLKSPDSLANGSLMRNGVVAGMASSLEEAWEITLLHGLITHYAPLCQLCCAAQTWMIWNLLEATPLPQKNWVTSFQPTFSRWLQASTNHVICQWRNDVEGVLEPAFNQLASAKWDPEVFNPFKGELHHMGYVLLTLQIAWWALQWSLRPPGSISPPRDLAPELFGKSGAWVLSWVAMIGADCDTYGATAGPLLAAAHGSLPRELKDGLWILRGLKSPR